jgi:hypothetical protein
MTNPSRARGFAHFRRIAPLAFVFALTTLATTGCEDKHIGRKCELGVSDDGGVAGGSSATINSEALECPSRICVLPENAANASTGPLCTADCSSDDDCSDGETTTDPHDTHHCKTSFVCTIPTTSGDLCCRKMCICKDFLIGNGPFNQTPLVCQSPAGGCKNVH